MPRRRTPPTEARTRGQDRNHPARHASRRPPSSVPLGAPSAHLGKDARTAWEGLAREIGWLTEADRALVELAAAIRGRMLAGEEVGLSALALLRQCLKDLGGTPVDRARITAPPEDEPQPDPAAKYLA